jgi:uncharacterized repeat protein (TIGR03806 family)
VNWRAAALAALLPLLAVACGGGSGGSGRHAFAFPLDLPAPTPMAPVRAFPNLQFQRPVLATTAGDGTGHLFVVEQSGRVLVIDGGEQVATARVFLDIMARVTISDGETGLLGLAFAPDYAQSGRFYVDYTRAGPLQTVVAEYRVSTDPLAADPQSERILLVQDQPFANHKAGMLAFGPDDLLYVALGDGGSGGDPFGNGQDPTTLLGKLLRIDPRGGSPYAIPPDNPFVGSGGGARGEVWALGLRNPWRFSFDRQTGDLWLADVGQGAREEIDIVTRGSNLGWNVFEGNAPFRNPGRLPSAAFTAPVLDYGHDLGNAVIGGLVVRGGPPELRGSYVYGDNGSGRVWSLRRAADGSVANAGIAAVDHPSAFGEDADGELLVVSHDGPLWRLAASNPGGAAFPRTLSATGLFTDLASLTPAPGLVEYEVNAPFWSDGAQKRRWLGSPLQAIGFRGRGPFDLPVGSVLVKHFALELRVGDPQSLVRLETRVLVHEAAGWAGYVYRWNETGTDAVLLAGREEVLLPIVDPSAPGGARTQRWTFPSRTDCRQCHTAAAGTALGIRSEQLHRQAFGEDQLPRLRRLGVLAGDPGGASAPWPDPYDSLAPADLRARAWLEVNCAMCHRPGGGTPSPIDLQFATPVGELGVVDVRPQLGDLGLADPWLVRPGDHSSSVLWLRLSRRDVTAMPPLASHEVDATGEDLIANWIDSLH